MKKLLSLLCALSLLLSLAACGQSSEDDTSLKTTAVTASETASTEENTVAGEITAIEDSQVTLLLGTLTEGEMPSGGGDGEAPEKPDGESGSAPTDDGTAPTDAGTPPADDGTAPTDAGTAPTDAGTEPTDAGTASTDAGTASTDSGTDSSEPPEMPDGESGGGTDGQMPEQSGMGGGFASFTAGEESQSYDLSSAELSKNGESISVSELAVGDILRITLDEDGNPTAAEVVNVGGGDMGGADGGFGGSGEVTQGSSANTLDTDGDYADTAYSSTGDDENALRVDGATVTLTGITVDKSAGSSSNTEDGDFYGMNAALLATNGAQVTISNATVTSSAQNGNGVFSYGSGTVVTISDSVITTTADNSGGIQTTGGGTTNASNLTVTTSGSSSAAIRSDRGGGTVNVDGGIYTTNGLNSPAVYSTADITVKNATLTATGSEALVIEGANSITLENCDVSGNMSDTEGTSSDENVHNVMIYQSMSGDAEVGTSSFSMTGGSLTSNNGDLFYITNTHCVMTLSGVSLSNLDSEGALLRVSGNSASHGWGTAGENGAQLELTADSQTLEGDIIVDSISTLSLSLTNNSVLTGTITIVENAEGGTAVSDNAVVTIDSGCTWNLTGDCTISTLENYGTINYNGYTITLADGTVLSE